MVRQRLWLVGAWSLLAGCSESSAPPLPPCTSSGTPVALAVAAYVSIDPGPIDGCTVFPANATASPIQYLVIPQAASPTPDDSQTFRLRGAVPTSGVAPQLVGPVTAQLSPADEFHYFLRQSERDRSFPVQPQPKTTAPLEPSAQAPTVITPVDSGDVRTFKVCGNLKCSTTPTVTATAMKVGQHIAIFVDNAAPQQGGGLSQSDLSSLRDVFDTLLYETDTLAFGRESDIDSNAVVIVLMTNKVNQLVTSAQCTATGFVAGYFFGADIDPFFRSKYNSAEIFYSIVPDPNATLSCSHPVAQVTRIVPVTFVHEFQHMISYNQHVLKRGGKAEILWLNEAMSHYAEERGGRNYLPGDSLNYCRYVAGDLYNAAQYLMAPHNYFLVDTTGIGGLANRGAYWLFLRYLIDQYAADTSRVAVDAYTRSLDSTSATGVTNVMQHANNTPFATLVARWGLANWVSDLAGFTAPPELTYKAWSFRAAYNNPSPWTCSGSIPVTFPLTPATGAGPTLNLSGTLRAGSGMYFRVQQPGGAAGFTTLFSNGSGSALRNTLVPRLTVIRIQ